jgi:hypothetical protein
MKSADEIAEKTATNKRQSAAAGSDATLRKFDQRFRATLKDFQRSIDQPSPAEGFHEILLGFDHHLDHETSERKAIHDRLLAMENRTKKRSFRGFARYFTAICIGIFATLAWQSYGEATKQIIATRAPELGWSPETRQMIASWVQQLAWTKPPASPENAAPSSVPQTPQSSPVAQIAPEVVAPKTPAAPSLDPEQVHQIAVDLGALRQVVDQLAEGQGQMGREIDRLQGAVAEILIKIPDPPPPPAIAGPARKPKAVAPSSARGPTPLQLPPHP